MDSDAFSVLQDRIPRRHLHSHCVDAFPGECACYASLQGDYWLVGEGGGKERQRVRVWGFPRDPHQRLVNISHCCYLH